MRKGAIIMNKARRKELEKAADLISQAMDIVDSVLEEEQNAYDSLPDSIRDSSRGEQFEDGISELEDARETVTSALEDVERIIGS